MIGKIRKFVGEVRIEMSKVTWSTRQELLNSTMIVLVTMAFLAVFIGAADLFFANLVRFLLR